MKTHLSGPLALFRWLLALGGVGLPRQHGLFEFLRVDVELASGGGFLFAMLEREPRAGDLGGVDGEGFRRF